MPEHCSYLRVRLQMEHRRLLNWCQVARVGQDKNSQDLPDSLKPVRVILIAILTEICLLMNNLAELNGKYVKLRPDDISPANKEALEMELVEELARMPLYPNREVTDQKHPGLISSLPRLVSRAINVIKQPKRLHLIIFSEEEYTKLLERLAILNDYLQGLLDDYQARKLDQVTQNTYLGMVQVRDSQDDLKQLAMAAILLIGRSSSHLSSGAPRYRADQALATLAKFKSLNAASTERSLKYESGSSSTRLSYSQIEYHHEPDSNPDVAERARTNGKFTSGDGTTRSVWIEWRPYVSKYDGELDTTMPTLEHLKRIKELVSLLQAEKVKEFCAPHCLGYFDNRDHMDYRKHDFRFGLVFEKPEAIGEAEPVSLHHMILKTPKPSLTDRIALAHKIAVCVLYLHAVNWLHKALRSDSVIFFCSPEVSDISEPCISGFEYARPNQDWEASIDVIYNEWSELYVHPDYQGLGPKMTCQKSFDIYSFGIILLEIAYWSKIEEILKIDVEASDIADLKKLVFSIV